ncbi:hypothetical protein NA57DRAFT_81548 [Rhizodiscina lignyota]|uniref:HIT-type domain-containing protein n=1 Tax=Rhizodiscina lignyota TaxID=1504668 RepID=A0A9P4I5S4_9PEZI|nr:hypothetical protein NA57DRAFT_81548 [Rhizodiscina lignyota]
MSVICGICKAHPPKYKCPTCKLPYCSIACYKNHKATHDSGSVSQDTPAPPITPQAVQVPKPSRPGLSVEDVTKHPAFVDLLKRHPQLKAQLGSMYSRVRSRPPVDRPTNSYQAPRRDQEQSRQKKADEHVLQLMKWGRNSDTADGQAMKEFIELMASLQEQSQESNG